MVEESGVVVIVAVIGLWFAGSVVALDYALTRRGLELGAREVGLLASRIGIEETVVLRCVLMILLGYAGASGMWAPTLALWLGNTYTGWVTYRNWRVVRSLSP
jgi:hypothetical protein